MQKNTTAPAAGFVHYAANALAISAGASWAARAEEGVWVHPEYKVWLEAGDYMFGDGIAALLEQIDASGSIYRASRELKMSYRYAWGTVRKAEQRLGYALLVKRVGGGDGGGAALTPAGRLLLSRYQAFRAEVDAAINSAFGRHFAGDLLPSEK